MNPEVARWASLIVPTARRHRLAPSLIAGLVEIESVGVPDAVSRAGAVGLGQIMPSPLIAGRPTADELRNPATNVEWTCRILAANRTRLGTQAGALAAYYGAASLDGRPTGATDGSGVTGWDYVRLVETAALEYLDLDQRAYENLQQYAPQTGGWLEVTNNLLGIATSALEAGRRAAKRAAETVEDWGTR